MSLTQAMGGPNGELQELSLALVRWFAHAALFRKRKGAGGAGGTHCQKKHESFGRKTKSLVDSFRS